MKRPLFRIRSLALFFVGVLGLLLAFFPLRGQKTAHAEPAAAKSAAPAAHAPPARPEAHGHTKAVPPGKDAGAGDAGAGDAGVVAEPPAEKPEKPKGSEKDKESEKDDIAIPTGKGLPIEVHVAVFFLEVKSFDDTKGEFECTVDLRLRWYDLAQRYPAAEAFRGYKEARGKKADALIEKMWTPSVDVVNRTETGGYIGKRLRIYPDGLVELITRTTGKHTTHISAESFPFDTQQLLVDLLIREETTDELVLQFEKDDVEFSRVAPKAELDGWNLGLVNLHGSLVSGWNGDRYSRVTASLQVDRVWSTGLAPIFIPLFASLLIPLLALWMNHPTEEGFQIEAFELANIGIGGLFSVIALSFAVYSSYGVIAGGDNTVTRLFGLNYATLAISLAVVVLFFRFNLPKRLFGHHVQTAIFNVLLWALPLLTAATALAFLLVAAQ